MDTISCIVYQMLESFNSLYILNTAYWIEYFFMYFYNRVVVGGGIYIVNTIKHWTY